MEKGDEFSTRAVEGLLVDQADTRLSGLLKLTFDMVCPERDMMNAAVWIFFEELGDRALRVGRFEQLQVDFTDVEEGGADLLREDLLAMLAFQAESFFVVRNGLVERPNGDSKMIDFLKHSVFLI